MKKNIVKTILVLIFGLHFSCISDDITTLNEDKKNATTADASAFFMFAQKALSDNLTGPDYRAQGPRIAKLWVQQLTSVTYLEGATYISEFSWEPLYRQVLMNLEESANTVLESTDTPKVKANKIAMIEIMKVYTYSILIDSYGNIPYSEALEFKNPMPKYDDAETVYIDLLRRLNEAINNLDSAEVGFGSSDLIYAGNIQNWKKFGNSLKLRMGMRVIDALPQIGTDAVTQSVSGVISSNNENAVFKYLGEFPNTNPWWSVLVRQGLKYYVGAKPFIDTMNNLDDPRLPIYFAPVNGEFVGAKYGIVQDFFTHSREGDLLKKPELPFIFIDYAQVEFLLAEAAERGITGVTDPEAHYNSAINASLSYYGIEASVINEYLAHPDVNYSTADGTWQKKIGIQKWIALFDQGFEAWTEYRRLDYPQLSAPEFAESDIVPLRFLYPISEQTLNGNNYQTGSSDIGGDTYSTKLFWDIH